MKYNESHKALNTLSFHNHIMFRMAISHLMDVGIRHLTPELIEETCKEIMQEDDSKRIMTNEFQCDLVRMAGQIAKVDHIHTLAYISRNVFYDVGDNGFGFQHAIEIISKLIDYIENDVGSYQDCYDILKECDIEDEDIRFIGYDYLIPEEEEE